MFTLEEVLSVENQNAALEHLALKKNGCGSDGMMLSELPVYWKQNKENIIEAIRNEQYVPGLIKTIEIINGAGKRRTISIMNTVDRLITRMLAQMLKKYLDPLFLEDSYAYQEGKGILEALEKSKEYIAKGNQFLVEIDIKDYFDNIPMDRMYDLICDMIYDENVLKLIHSYLFCSLLTDDEVIRKERGLVQGSPLSPIFSNLYLHNLDMHLSKMHYCWIRFADNIYVFCKGREQAQNTFNHLNKYIPKEFDLQLNVAKSGIYDVFTRVVLGYDFVETRVGIEIRKHKYDMSATFHNWNSCKVNKINKEYHIVEDGILTKKDYALLFESETGKHHLPVEVLDQINFYGNVTLCSNVFQTLSKNNIKLSVFDKYGNLSGSFIPCSYDKDATAFLKQVSIYNDEKKRLELAKKMEIASFHNMRSNLRYYYKKGAAALADKIDYLTDAIKEINEATSVNTLLLVEARARQTYYHAFNEIVHGNKFVFYKRSKQPPLDEMNAMISFGNTLLYNEFLRIIFLTSLDPKIGIVHATNRRSYSLNLDFADIFKPIIVDRIIFTLINCHIIEKEHFEGTDDGAVLLNKTGKRIFLQEFQNKLETYVNYKGKRQNYQNLLIREVREFMRSIEKDEKYHPYKYY